MSTACLRVCVSACLRLCVCARAAAAAVAVAAGAGGVTGLSSGRCVLSALRAWRARDFISLRTAPHERRVTVSHHVPKKRSCVWYMSDHAVMDCMGMLSSLHTHTQR